MYSPALLSDIENSIDKYLIPRNAKEQDGDKAAKKEKERATKEIVYEFLERKFKLEKFHN